MDLLITGVISLVLLVCAVVWVRGHVQSWRKSRLLGLPADERDFRRSQLRRRMQTSIMLGVLAVAIFLGTVLFYLSLPAWLVTSYWCGVVLLSVWITLLAIADLVATHFHFRRLQNRYTAEQIRLEAALRRLQNAAGNGQEDQP
jgi:UDP-N-acetylmuramyl pentapeptide phosphotransferase/UDP-N-acetylglucosamine-1-phosphate transferase